MEVPATGMGALGPERMLTTPAVPPLHLARPSGTNAALALDSVAALLGELSQADLTNLLEIVEAPLRTLEPARAQELLHAVTEAVAARDLGHALDLLGQFAHLDPGRTETLPSEPAMAMIRPALEQLLSQTTAGARLHAESQLAEATRKLEMEDFKFIGEVRPELFLVVAGKLLEAGGLVNYVRSSAASAMLLDQGRWVPAVVSEPISPEPESTAWRLNFRLLVVVWVSLGIVALGFCWWLREGYLSAICWVWGAGLLLLFAGHVWRQKSRF